MSAAREIVSDRPSPGLKSQVMSALRWSAFAKFGGQIINWAITLFVIRLLAPADYGLVAMLTLIFMFLAMLGDMGFGSSIVQAPTLDEHEIRQTLGAALIVNLGICALLMIGAPAIAAFYNEPRLVDMTRVAALGFIASGVAPVYSGLLAREMRFKAAARIEIVGGIIGNLATLFFAWRGYGAWALILGGLLAYPFRIAMLVSAASKFYWPSFGIRGTRRLWIFGGNILVTRVVGYWSSQADVLIAGKFLGSAALGFYSVAVHLASLPMQRAGGIINGVAFAAFAKIQHDKAAVLSNTRLSVRLIALVTFPVLWGIAAVAPELVGIALGPSWLPSVIPLIVVALTIPIRMIGAIINTTMLSMGRVDIGMATSLIGACFSVPLFYIGSRYGILGLSMAWLVVTPFLFMLAMFRAMPILGLSFGAVVSETWRPIAVAAAMFLAVEGARQILVGLPAPLLFAIFVALGATIYCGGNWLINRTSSIEALALLFPHRFSK